MNNHEQADNSLLEQPFAQRVRCFKE